VILEEKCHRLLETAERVLPADSYMKLIDALAADDEAWAPTAAPALSPEEQRQQEAQNRILAIAEGRPCLSAPAKAGGNQETASLANG
jgi:hypothetical protein